MRRTAILGICLVAVLAVAATTASVAAAALPEFTPPFPNMFTSTSKATTLETVGKTKLKCTADTNKGEVTGPSTALVTISFTGCAIVHGPRCQSPNGVAGEIITDGLLGTLGYISRVPKEVGLDLSTATGAPLAVFFCGEDVTGEITRSVIGKITPINKVIKPSGHATLKFAQKAGHQAVTMFLGGPLDVPFLKLGLAPSEEAGLSSSDKIVFASPVMIVA